MYRAKYGEAEFYGIPGMKWGKRKKETLEGAKKKYGIKDEPSTAENLGRVLAAVTAQGVAIAGTGLAFTPKGRKLGRLIKAIPKKLVEAGPRKTLKQVGRGISNIYKKSSGQITDKILRQYNETSASLDEWKPFTTETGRQIMAEADLPFSGPVEKTNRDMAIKREINMRRDHFTQWLRANTKPGELDVAEVNTSLKRRAGAAEKEMRNRFSNIKPDASVTTLTKYDPGPNLTEIDSLINDAAIAREGLQKMKGRRKKIPKARRQEIARQYAKARDEKFGFSGSLIKVADFSTASKKVQR